MVPFPLGCYFLNNIFLCSMQAQVNVKRENFALIKEEEVRLGEFFKKLALVFLSSRYLLFSVELRLTLLVRVWWGG